MRKSAFKKLLELTTEELDQIELQFFLRNRDLRFITIPDCMFYVKEKPKILRNELLKLAQTFSFNKISIESDTFEFTCQEEGVSNLRNNFKRLHVELSTFSVNNMTDR